MLANYAELLQLKPWRFNDTWVSTTSREEKVRLAYDRARTVLRHSGVTSADVLGLSPKFWDYHRDLIAARCDASNTIVAIQWNLVIGTIAPFAKHRPDLVPILKSLEKLDIAGDFMLSETGHGLDARNIETTATLLPDGQFDLHTPSVAAAKIMPPTTPEARIARIAVVFAQTIVEGQNHGVKPFLVHINDGDGNLYTGIESKPLPQRPGSRHVDHAITTFHHVQLAAGSLLGSLEKPKDLRQDFIKQIWRVNVGTLALSQVNVPMLTVATYVAGKYSLVRKVADNSGESTTVPIFSFSTQQRPILSALAAAAVFEEYSKDAIKQYMVPRDDLRVQHGLACVYKTVVGLTVQHLMNDLVDRCGWQGLYSHNLIITLLLALRGNGIAEGDTMVLSIRLAAEIIQGRYILPPPRQLDHPLVRRENGLIEEARKTAATFKHGHRSSDFNTHILPQCVPIVEAIGQRMAYEAARDSKKVRPEYLQLYESNCMLADQGWFVEHEGFKRASLNRENQQIVASLAPQIETLLSETGAEPYAVAPILSSENWQSFLGGLERFTPPADNMDNQRNIKKTDPSARL